MREQRKILVRFVKAFPLIVALNCFTSPVNAEQTESFVFLADSRSREYTDSDPINTAVLSSILHNISQLTPAPKVVVFGGDAAWFGGKDNPHLHQYNNDNLDAFNNLVNQYLPSGTKFAFAVGNHEVMTPICEEGSTDCIIKGRDYEHALTKQQNFQATSFNSGWAQNGPAGYNNLAFSFSIGNSLFIVTDSYYVNPVTGHFDCPGTKNCGVDYTPAQVSWIQGLVQNSTASHVFVFSHTPPWTPSSTVARDGTPARAVEGMEQTWQTVSPTGAADTKASIFFAGHDHLYFRTQQSGGAYEVLAGSAGAPYECESSSLPPIQSTQPDNIYKCKYDYAVVSVEGRQVDVRVFDEHNVVLDSFQIFDNSGAQNSVIHNAAPIIGPTPSDTPPVVGAQPSGILAGSNNRITNSALIRTVHTGIDAVSSNTIINSGEIEPSSGGNGVYVYDNNTITNTLSGNIHGNSPASGLWGIRVGAGNTIVNHGVIDVTGTDSVGVLAQGADNSFTNTGALSASGTGSYAAKFVGVRNSFVNTGSINGVVIFDGDGHIFSNTGSHSGATIVNSGVLEVIDTTTAPTVVNAGGVLAGAARVASVGVHGGGALAPGSVAAIGNMHVEGDLTFDFGSSLVVRLQPAGNDHVDVSNIARLRGTVSMVAGSGWLTPGAVYNVLTSQGSVSGVFDDVASNHTFLTATPGYDAHNVFLTVTRNALPLSSVTLTSNQASVAQALDLFPQTNPLYVAVVNQTPAGARQAFDALSGEVHGSAQTAILYDSQYSRQAVLGRLRQAPFAGAEGPTGALGSGGPTVGYAASASGGDNGALGFPAQASPLPFPAASSPFSVWAQGVGAWGDFNSDGNAAAVQRDFSGLMSGIDRPIGGGWRSGLAVGYTTSSVGVNARASSATIDAAHLAAYAGTSAGPWNFRSSALFSWNTVDTSRWVLFPNFAEKVAARYDVGEAQAFGEIGYGAALGSVAVEPFAGLAYVHLGGGSFTEAGGLSALRGAVETENLGFFTLGARAAGNYLQAGGMTLTPRASLAWRHAFGDVTPTSPLAFAATGIGFGVAGLTLAPDVALAEAGVDLVISPQASFSIFYLGALADSAQDNSVRGSFVWRF